MENPYEIKRQLYTHCLTYVEQRITRARQAMDAAQEAANAESKSSAGDKYETTRAIMQLEKEMHMGQLAEALKLKKELELLAIDQPYERVLPGSLVLTDTVRLFIAISVGKVVLDSQEYLVVSAVSPLGAKLGGAVTGNEVSFNGKVFRIQVIY